MQEVPQELAALRQLIPTNSTIMMDVQWHWTNLWWAARKRNWPLAQYYFTESRGHIQQLVRKNPTLRNQVDGTDVDLKGIFDGIDTSSLARRFPRRKCRRSSTWIRLPLGRRSERTFSSDGTRASSGARSWTCCKRLPFPGLWTYLHLQVASVHRTARGEAVRVEHVADCMRRHAARYFGKFIWLNNT